MPSTAEMFSPYSGSTTFLPGQKVYSIVPNPFAPPNYVKTGIVQNIQPSGSGAGNARGFWYSVRWDRDSVVELVAEQSMSLYYGR